MNLKLNQIFKKEKNIIIGAIHLPPLPGYIDFPGKKVAVKNALADLDAFEEGGVDGVIFENNYDIPHKELISSRAKDMMIKIGRIIKKAATIPVGVSVLWNDFYSAMDIAKILKLDFIRVPVFVDTVKTDYGVIRGKPEKILEYRKKINAENVALFTDIQVKHARLISSLSLIQSAELAIKKGADTLIITGSWTGDPPRVRDIIGLKNHIGNFPIFIGSGLNRANITKLFHIANGAIVSTSLKEGQNNKMETNIKPYQAH